MKIRCGTDVSQRGALSRFPGDCGAVDVPARLRRIGLPYVMEEENDDEDGPSDIVVQASMFFSEANTANKRVEY